MAQSESNLVGLICPEERFDGVGGEEDKTT